MLKESINFFPLFVAACLPALFPDTGPQLSYSSAQNFWHVHQGRLVPFFSWRDGNLHLPENLPWKWADNKGLKQQSLEKELLFSPKAKQAARILTAVKLSCFALSLGSDTHVSLQGTQFNHHTNLKRKEKATGCHPYPEDGVSTSYQKAISDNPKAIIRRDWEQFKDQKPIFLVNSKLEEKNHFSLKKPSKMVSRSHAHC